MEIRVLGPVELIGSSGQVVTLRGNKVRGLLAMLALDAGRTVTTQRLIDVLWGEQAVNGINVVQVIVSKLRRALGEAGEPTCLTTQLSGYRLEIERDAVDALRFDALVSQAREVTDDPASVRSSTGTRSRPPGSSTSAWVMLRKVAVTCGLRSRRSNRVQALSVSVRRPCVGWT